MENSKKYLDEQFASLIETLKDESFKKELVKNINEDIDIPILSEKTEKNGTLAFCPIQGHPRWCVREDGIHRDDQHAQLLDHKKGHTTTLFFPL